MTTQQEWREIAYQRSLGEQGYGTGNIHNQAGLDEYQRRQQAERSVTYTDPGSTGTSTAGTQTGRGTRTGPTRPMSPAAACIILGGLVGLGAWLATSNWPIAIASFGASAALLGVISVFARSELGAIVGFFIQALLAVALFAGFVTFVWSSFGAEPALWILGIAATLVTLVAIREYVSTRYYRWRKTPGGQLFLRRWHRVQLLMIVVALAAGGYWLFGPASPI